jgi:hypothetical protein
MRSSQTSRPSSRFVGAISSPSGRHDGYLGDVAINGRASGSSWSLRADSPWTKRPERLRFSIGLPFLSEVKARYLTGLTATPRRRDGLHPILEMQLGPVRFAVDAKSQAARRPFEHRLIVRHTAFVGGALDPAQGIQTLYASWLGTSGGTG